MLKFLRSGRARAVARFLVTALAVTALLSLLFALLFWRFYKPKLIDYTVIRAVAQDYKLSPALNSTSEVAELRGTFYFTIAANNSNAGVSVHYDRVEAHVESKEADPLAVTGGPALRKINNRQTWLNFRAVAAQSAHVRVSSSDALTLDIRIQARLLFQYAGITSWPFHLQIFCQDVVISMSTPPPLGAPSFQSHQCYAGFL